MVITEEMLKDLETMPVRAVERKYSCYDGQIRKQLAKKKKPEKTGVELIKGESTLYDEEGNIKLKWVKTHVREQTALEAFKQAVEDFKEDMSILSPITIPAPTEANKDILSVYTIGDAHVGMLADKLETGETTNIKIVQEDLIEAMKILVKKSDNSAGALIIDVGDWFHSDNQNNRTAHSGNSLDVDGRYPSVLKVGLMLAVHLIQMTLQKHETVTWRSAIGNHNEHSAIMMSAFLGAWFRNEPRVVIADTPSMFYYHKWGKNLIGITHGHTAKAEKLGEIMSVDCKKDWSDTDYRYWYTGHVHHQSVKEFSNCVVETFCTLTGKDAWHSASGYRSNQSMKCITLHKEYGEIDRATVGIRQVRNG